MPRFVIILWNEGADRLKGHTRILRRHIIKVPRLPFGGDASPGPGPHPEADCATLAGLHLGTSGWAVAPGKRGSAAAQKPWTPGEERLSVRTGSPAPIAAPRPTRRKPSSAVSGPYESLSEFCRVHRSSYQPKRRIVEISILAEVDEYYPFWVRF